MSKDRKSAVGFEGAGIRDQQKCNSAMRPNRGRVHQRVMKLLAISESLREKSSNTAALRATPLVAPESVVVTLYP